MTSETIQITTHRCHLLQSHAQPKAIVVKPLGPFEWKCLEEEFCLTEQMAGQPIGMAAFEMDTLDSFRLPDPTTLGWITAQLLPMLKGRWDNAPMILGGYSLGGLFALWASTCTDEFTAVAAGSPSLWADWWGEYAAEHPSRAKWVYMSVGNTEDHTRKMPYALMGECLRKQHALNQQQLGTARCTLEWNEGGHFANIEVRKAKAFAWCVNHCLG